MMQDLRSFMLGLQQRLAWLRNQVEALGGLVKALAAIVQQLRTAGAVLFGHRQPDRAAQSYETLWLDLVLELQDARGRRAVLTRRQRVRFLAADGAVVRELVWGEGEQLVRYTARGARRMRVRPEGSKRAVLLDPNARPARGDEFTITSRRTIRNAFRKREEYCEALLERPTGRLAITIHFPRERPPKEACLVLAATETVLRRIRPHYGPHGRASLRCQLRKPLQGTVYSLRWRW